MPPTVSIAQDSATALNQIDSIPFSGSPWGRTGAAAHNPVRSTEPGRPEPWAKVDIMFVMSSAAREGFWRAPCRSCRGRDKKPRLITRRYQPVPSAATCPKALGGRPGQLRQPVLATAPAGGGSDRPPSFSRVDGWVSNQTRPPPQAAQDRGGLCAGLEPEEVDAPLFKNKKTAVKRKSQPL
jgi:hypothetical protein